MSMSMAMAMAMSTFFTRSSLLVTSKSSSSSSPEQEIRVCTNKTCRKQGSQQTLQTLTSLAPPNISVTSSGCLGKCGSGPNIVFLPQAVFVNHCATPARAAQVLDLFLGRDGWVTNLEALALRERGEEEMEKGEVVQGLELLNKAIDLKPSGGLHVIYKTRSAARLAIGDSSGALEDANEALAFAPQYPEAYQCQGDAFLALEDFAAAENSYSVALEIDPSIRRSKSFKARVMKLHKKLSAADIAS